jgi:hypothetical protein
MTLAHTNPLESEPLRTRPHIVAGPFCRSDPGYQLSADAAIYDVDDEIWDRRLDNGTWIEIDRPHLFHFFAANGVLRTLEQTISPINWFHDSLHPNRQGPRADARQSPRMARPARRSRGRRAVLGRRQRRSFADRRRRDKCQGAAGNDLEFCTQSWRLQSTRAALPRGRRVLRPSADPSRRCIDTQAPVAPSWTCQKIANTRNDVRFP